MNAPNARVRTQCEICGGIGDLWLESGPRRLVRCRDCGFTWIPEGVVYTPRGLSIYEDEHRDFYSQYTDYYRDESAIDAARAKVEWVSRFVPSGRRVLDVGANVGAFVKCASDRFDAIGIEPNPGAVAWAREHMHAKVESGSIFDELSEYVGCFDAVTMLDVIEHVDEPTAALRQCRRYLAPGGLVFITTPDIGSLCSRVLGRGWYYIDFEQHVSLFSAATLTRLLLSEGFDIVDRRTFGRRYRFSYIEQRLKDLSHQSPVLRVLHGLSLPLRLAPSWYVPINLGDVVGIAARTRSTAS
ncbi:MAG TPA: methyltransferase domain-containing protein [Vicinamibacterales bacterium]|jgi:2-polyprenyl-3-methyl-5-hydroxy-6-metoxy-1,4-benzoquinol methylase|nr:methyltransferase domain-containing protein [Vicinamibacterales bacterium]